MDGNISPACPAASLPSLRAHPFCKGCRSCAHAQSINLQFGATTELLDECTVLLRAGAGPDDGLRESPATPRSSAAALPCLRRGPHFSCLPPHPDPSSVADLRAPQAQPCSPRFHALRDHARLIPPPRGAQLAPLLLPLPSLGVELGHCSSLLHPPSAWSSATIAHPSSTWSSAGDAPPCSTH